jgi:hypothetical protein
MHECRRRLAANCDERCDTLEFPHGAFISETSISETVTPEKDNDYVSLYRRAFAEFGTFALWNVRRFESPTPQDALIVARTLRFEGNLTARRLAEQIEEACHAAV